MDNLRFDVINDNISIIQSKHGLTFTTDAYLLSAFVKKPKGKYRRMAELGAGTGVVSLLCAVRGRADEITAIEIQERFFDIMKRNIESNRLLHAVKPVCADVRNVNEQTLDGQFDAVFTNPPYMRAGSGKKNCYDEAAIARHEVYGGLHDFCAAAGRLCRFGGDFYIVYRPERLAELFYELRICGFEPKTLTLMHPEEGAPPSLIFCSAKRGGHQGGLCIMPPLFVYKHDRGTQTETEVFRRIYETGSFPEYDSRGRLILSKKPDCNMFGQEGRLETDK